MKMTEIQKEKRKIKLLNYQTKCVHLNIEQNKDNLFQCESCNKIFRKDEKWHGHTYEELK